MAKQKGDFMFCLRMTKHHVASDTLRLMALTEGLNIDNVGYRFKLVEENMANAIAQLKKVQDAAEKAGCQEVLDALNEQIEAGHDWPAPAAT